MSHIEQETPMKTRRLIALTPGLPTAKTFGLVAASVLLTLLAACSGGDSKESTGASPSVDPAANPSIDDTFAVAPDGRKDALVCWGKGSPTVLLETGGTNIEEWTGTGLVSELAPITRVCTYDRAGTGKSDAAPNKRRDAEDVVKEANALLTAAHLDGPLVLVGRSFGGMIMTHYAEVLPDDVVGVVVLDTPAPSAEFTEESEPELVWDSPGNKEHLDVVGGFENRFAKDPPHFDAPLLLITPVQGEASAKNESFWLQVSAKSEQVEMNCDPSEGPCATRVATFVKELGTN
jgi:pimeloyl-ACP methyl ester carboxylesterase